jgi:hypothetical protein
MIFMRYDCDLQIRCAPSWAEIKAAEVKEKVEIQQQ